jgi:hypothetical protein
MSDFTLDPSFTQAEVSGGLELDRYEEAYRQLFTEALADGVITPEERAQLARAASNMGLDAGRLQALEGALEAAYKARHGVAVLDIGKLARSFELAAPVVAQPEAEVTAPRSARAAAAEVEALRTRISALEARVHQLETELEAARTQMAVEIDLSDFTPAASSSLGEGAEILQRRLACDPRDATTLHSLVLAHAGALDRQWCVAQVLDYLGEANDFERELHEQHRVQGLITPKCAIDAAGWHRHLAHPEDEPITGDVLGGIVAAVLLAHSAALQGRQQLPRLLPEQYLDPKTSTAAVVRAFSWAAQTLGMAAPWLYAAPQADVAVQMVPVVPPVCVLGGRALSGRSIAELAFIAGQHLAYFRQERFIRLLVPDLRDLEDMFLGALLIGDRTLKLSSQVRARVEPIAAAIEPLLEPAQIDRLRSAQRRFVEHGGRTNLQRWARAADLTAVRAGFTLCSDLGVAERMLTLQGLPQVGEKMDDLIIFATSDRYANLRASLGIAVG